MSNEMQTPIPPPYPPVKARPKLEIYPVTNGYIVNKNVNDKFVFESLKTLQDFIDEQYGDLK